MYFGSYEMNVRQTAHPTDEVQSLILACEKQLFLRSQHSVQPSPLR